MRRWRGSAVRAGITEDESALLTQNRLNKLTSALTVSLSWFQTLSAVRQAVLLNMAYNLGLPHLMAFRLMLSYVQQAQYDQAAAEMLNSLWATQTGARATRLAEQMKTGEWI